MFYSIPIRSSSDPTKTYNVIIDETLSMIECNCIFWVASGKLRGEPCRHMEIAVASIKVEPKLLKKYYTKLPKDYDPFDEF